VKEMTDLSPAEQSEFMHAVLSVERVLRALYAPDKINLASLGNRVSHLHWHVIARSQDDRHFPEAVWAAPVRDSRVIWPKVEDDPLRAALLQALTQGAPIAS
jgi:diadenosine tetraphosphate (Ap4A) HIT family hydrolase